MPTNTLLDNALLNDETFRPLKVSYGPFEALINRILGLENNSEVLQAFASSFDEVEEDYHHLNADPDDKHKVELPPNLLDTNRDSIGIDSRGDDELQEILGGTLHSSAISRHSTEYSV